MERGGTECLDRRIPGQFKVTVCHTENSNPTNMGTLGLEIPALVLPLVPLMGRPWPSRRGRELWPEKRCEEKRCKDAGVEDSERKMANQISYPATDRAQGLPGLPLEHSFLSTCTHEGLQMFRNRKSGDWPRGQGAASEEAGVCMRRKPQEKLTAWKQNRAPQSAPVNLQRPHKALEIEI